VVLADLHSFPTRRSSDLSERFAQDQLIYSEIDLLKLVNYRCRNTSYMEYGYLKDMKFRKVQFKLNNIEADDITRDIQPHPFVPRSEEHTSELQSRENLVC